MPLQEGFHVGDVAVTAMPSVGNRSEVVVSWTPGAGTLGAVKVVGHPQTRKVPDDTTVNGAYEVRHGAEDIVVSVEARGIDGIHREVHIVPEAFTSVVVGPR